MSQTVEPSQLHPNLRQYECMDVCVCVCVCVSDEGRVMTYKEVDQLSAGFPLTTHTEVSLNVGTVKKFSHLHGSERKTDKVSTNTTVHWSG